MKFTTNIRIDIPMIFAFAVLIVSGVGIHVTDGFVQHDIWHNWAVIHVIASVSFLVLGIYHIIGHWVWFKGLAKSMKKKSKPNIVLTLLFLFETVTGAILLAFTDGGNSHIGLWHWWAGLIMTAFVFLYG